MKELVRLYKKFNEFHGKKFSKDVKSWLGVSELNLSDKAIKEVYKIFYKDTFIEFCTYLRDFIYTYANNPFNFIKETNKETWDLQYYLSFLKSEGLVKIKNGKIVADETLKEKLIPRYSEKEIFFKLHRKFAKFKLASPTLVLVNRMAKRDFKFKPKLDQLPISVESAVTLIATIFKYYPLPQGFLFVGDDDFISVISSAIEPKFLPMVTDLDEDILRTVSEINKNILTFKRDFTKKKTIREKILGFCTNPPYTEKGIKTFLNFGMLHFSKLGGRIFLEFGDEAIGRKLLFLQEFFVKKNLEITELIKGKINYPFMAMHPEDKIIFKKLLKFFDGGKIKRNYMLGADLYVLTHIPWQVKRVKVKNKIYSYI